MEILYSDSKIAVAVKPRGVLSVDEPGGMPELLRAALGDVSAPLYTVHRLDAAVGGVMVFARTRHAAGDLSREIREGHFHKEYLAVIRGRPEPPVDTFADHMLYDRRRRMAFAAEEPGPDAKEARLSFAVIGEEKGLALAWIELHTGRTHQIRFQFARRGFPLWGDRKYGPGGDPGPIALWSCAVGFTHPATGEKMHFALEPPAEYPWTLFIGRGEHDGSETHDALLSGT